jgi:plastocyanin
VISSRCNAFRWAGGPRSRPLQHLAMLVFTLAALVLTSCGRSGGASHPPPTSPDPTPSASVSAGSSPSMVPASSAPGQVETVEQVNATGMGGAFKPAQVRVPKGGTVQWVNHSGNIHNVTFADPSLGASPIMYANDRYSRTFQRSGTYHYACTFHPGMEGTITVG